VELYASLSGFARQLGEEIQLAEEGPAWFSKALFDRASAGDAAVLAVLEGARTSLSRFGELMVAVVEPDTIIYTGEGSVLLRWISSNEVGIPPVPVVEGKHGGSAVIEGALLQAQWGLIERPIL
jgi:predicted NBD/HSP70 family sugar kinase